MQFQYDYCYSHDMMPLITDGLRWFASADAMADAVQLCSTRDTFQARLDSFYRVLLKCDEMVNEVALLIAVIGEIGNNCFDHNLGQWRDVAGCWFAQVQDRSHWWIALADRGQGILASLRRVDGTIATHQAALEIAFRRQLSGRAPEQRGNGLKFVRRVINGHQTRGLCCISGDGKVAFGGLTMHLPAPVASLQQQQIGSGTLTIIGWGPS